MRSGTGCPRLACPTTRQSIGVSASYRPWGVSSILEVSVRKILIYLSLTVSLVAGLVVILSPSASATFHLVKVREVYAGSTTDPTAQYVELQMYSAGQVFLSGHTLSVYDATGKDVGDFTFTAPVTNA